MLKWLFKKKKIQNESNEVKLEDLTIESRRRSSLFPAFYKRIEEIFKCGNNNIISCSEFDRAALVHALLFENAGFSVKIISNNLTADIFNNRRLAESAEKAINLQLSVDVIVKGIPEESLFLNMLKKYEDKQSVNLILCDDGGIDCNFEMSVADNQSYYFCTETGHSIANAKDYEMALKFAKNFNVYKDLILKSKNLKNLLAVTDKI